MSLSSSVCLTPRSRVMSDAKRPMSVCPVPDCRALNCTRHKRDRDADRKGYDHAWRRVRKVKLSRNPLCELCEHRGRVNCNDLEVHHVQPIATHPHLRLALEN